MTNPIALSPCAALLCLALSSPSSAAQPAVVATAPTPAASDVATSAAADGCRADLKAFDARMEKDGYWRSGGGYGFGFPMGEAGFGMYGESAYQDRPWFLGHRIPRHSARPRGARAHRRRQHHGAARPATGLRGHSCGDANPLYGFSDRHAAWWSADRPTDRPGACERFVQRCRSATRTPNSLRPIGRRRGAQPE